jgi:general stress protein 26
MPVWGLWHEESFWFSSSKGSRKARNLAADPRCVVSTEDAMEPVIIEGTAELITDGAKLDAMLALENAKYETDYGIELMDPDVNAAFRVRPRWGFGLTESDFTGSPTRWSFETMERMV